jgi:hypothetical protein
MIYVRTQILVLLLVSHATIDTWSPKAEVQIYALFVMQVEFESKQHEQTSSVPTKDS